MIKSEKFDQTFVFIVEQIFASTLCVVKICDKEDFYDFISLDSCFAKRN